jgi:tartrate dehydratase beta subunit/fumarate hydratase class I family protein
VAFEKLSVGHCVVLNGKILYCRVAIRINVRMAMAKLGHCKKKKFRMCSNTREYCIHQNRLCLENENGSRELLH